MSTTAVRLPIHAPSPSYVPRSSSRPSSPMPPSTFPRSTSTPHLPASLPSRPVSPMPSGLTPRMGDERRPGSSLRNEVEVEDGEVREVTREARENAKAVLKLLADLPAPLPETLPPNFLPTPTASPTTSPSSFSSFVHTQSRSPAKRRRSPLSPVGLGLGLSMDGVIKRHKSDSGSGKPISPELVRSVSSGHIPTRGLTPMGKSPIRSSGKVSSRFSSAGDESKEGWSKDKWHQAAVSYRDRALQLKRRGDAFARSPTAHKEFLHLPHDPLKGLLCLTDAVLLWLYSYFCEEQASGRVRSSPYGESVALREFVRKGWEKEMRGEGSERGSKADEDREARREMARAMVGLMHLIEAVVNYHLTSEQLHHLHKRSKELGGPSPPSTTSASPPGTGPSPASHISDSTNLPPDLIALITSSTTSSSRAAQCLLTSRHHLSVRLLRLRFPETFEYAINSELADEALPAPGDTLGAARRVDIDRPERFAWPIELGMCAPVAHTAAFGRCLVKEMADCSNRDWDLGGDS